MKQDLPMTGDGHPLPRLDLQAPQHVGAILLALREVLVALFEAEATFGEPRFRPAEAPLAHELTVAIGFSGDVDGWLALGMSRATAVALARTLMADPATAFGVLAGEGLDEVGNVLAGACAMALHRRGFRLKLGQPVVAVDEPLAIAWPTPLVLEVPVTPAEGRLDVAIGMRVRGAVPPPAALRIERIPLEF